MKRSILVLAAVGCSYAGCGTRDRADARPPADPVASEGGSVGPVASARIDPSPFGAHTAAAFGVAGDPYQPAREIGIAWTRLHVPAPMWNFVDPGRTGDPAAMAFSGWLPPHPITGEVGGPFDLDGQASDAVAAGMNVMWNVGLQPPAPGYTQEGSWLPTDEAAYVRFVEATVRRYPEVRVWQTGNEPNLERSRADLAAYHRLTHDAIKRVRPDAIVVLPGAAGFDPDYFGAVLDALDDRHVDVLDFHIFTDPVGGTISTGRGYEDLEEAARGYRALLDSRGFTGTAIWSTENGSFSGSVRVGLGGEAVDSAATEAEQARDLPKRYVVALASGVEKMFWAWGLSEGFGSWDHDAFDHTGLLYGGQDGRPAGTPKLAYWAYFQMTRQLAGCQWARVSRLETQIEHTRAYRCPLEGGGEAVVAWWDTFRVAGWAPGMTTEVIVPWAGATAVARAAVPSASSGAGVVEPATAFATGTLVPRGGTLTLTLGADPVYVRVE